MKTFCDWNCPHAHENKASGKTKISPHGWMGYRFMSFWIIQGGWNVCKQPHRRGLGGLDQRGKVPIFSRLFFSGLSKLDTVQDIQDACSRQKEQQRNFRKLQYSPFLGVSVNLWLTANNVTSPCCGLSSNESCCFLRFDHPYLHHLKRRARTQVGSWFTALGISDSWRNAGHHAESWAPYLVT